MPELRHLAQRLLDRPLVPTPDVADVAARAGAIQRRRNVRMAGAAVLSLLLLSTAVVVNYDSADGQQLRVADNGIVEDELPVDLPPGVGDLLPLPTSSTTSSSTTSTTTKPTTTTSTTAKPGGGPAEDPCPGGQNQGATDVGVTGATIKVLVRTGPTGSIGEQAAISEANQQGGVCGRRFELVQRVINPTVPFDDEGAFAVLANRFDPAVEQAALNGSLKTPVVGAEGLAKAEYMSGWQWPVGAPAASQARIAVDRGLSSGGKTFGIVYDTHNHYGIEAANAFKNHVRARTGNDPTAFVGMEPGKGSYAGEANQFNYQCGTNGCDVVLMALTAETAITYISSQTDKDGRRQGFGHYLTYGVSLLFNERFARDCGRPCDGMVLWTPFQPPVGQAASQPDVAAYMDAVKSVDPAVDVNNTDTLQSYLAGKLLVEAVRQTGARLTRDRLREKLDALVFSSGLLPAPLDWGASVPSQRVANSSAKDYRIVTASGSFVGFAEIESGWRQDPSPGTFS